MRCSKCKKQTPRGQFATFRTRKGEQRRRGVCKECRGQYAFDNAERLKKWRKAYNKKNRSKKAIDSAKRREAVKAIVCSLKANTPCTDCKKKFPAVAMDFDHVRGKNKPIATMVSQAYKIDLILEEIKLCDIVCACCHRIRTSKRKQNHAPRNK